MRRTIRKLATDPFVLLIAVVVLVPAGLAGVAIATQNKAQPTVDNVSQEASADAVDQTSSSSSAAAANDPRPITEAERLAAEDKQATPPAPAAPTAATKPAVTCDEAKKAAAINTRDSQLAQENALHERQKDKLRLSLLLTRKYWDEEHARHNAAVSQIESAYQAALAAANC